MERGRNMAIKFLVSDWLGKKKMTQKELSDLTGIRPATISALYHDKTKRIEVEQLENLCKAFGCTPGELIVLVDEELKTK